MSSLKDLDVSPGSDPAFLVISTSKGTAELWDFDEGKLLLDLPKQGRNGTVRRFQAA